MPRNYYKEPGTKYGRPKKKIGKKPPIWGAFEWGEALWRGAPDSYKPQPIPSPPSLVNYDEEMKGWNVRRFLTELATRQGARTWALSEWQRQGITGSPPTDPDEINKFLHRPAPVTRIDSKADVADALHALRLGMILIVIDPNTPDLRRRLAAETKAIRKSYPLPTKKPRGNPSEIGDSIGVTSDEIEKWRAHRIIALYDLELTLGYDPEKDRKQFADWLFHEQKDARARGRKLDRAHEYLQDALKALRVLDAQTRE